MTFFVLYLLMILENLQGYLFGVAIVSGILASVAIFFRGAMYIDDDDIKVFPLSVKILIGACLVLSLFGKMIPSKQDMAIIAAGGVTYNLVTSDGAKQIGSKGVDLLNKKLEQMLEDPVKAAKEGKAVVDEVNKK